MTPAERVAFILHDVFGYSFAEVAEIAGRTPAACRQLASSARRRVRASQAPATPAARQAGILRDFKQAWEARDIGAIIGLLDPDATMTADGGGLVSTVLHPVEGAQQIARYVVALAAWAPGLTVLERTVNGQPGLVAQRDGTSGQYATPTSSGPGRRADARLHTIRSAQSRCHPASPAHPGTPGPHGPARERGPARSRSPSQTHNWEIGAPPATRSAGTSGAPSRRSVAVPGHRAPPPCSPCVAGAHAPDSRPLRRSRSVVQLRSSRLTVRPA